MRILLLGINYSPERTGIAPYTTGLARHLSKKHSVTVLTGIPHYPDWTVPREHRHWRMEQTEHGVKVIRLGHYVPNRPSAVPRALYEITWALRALWEGRRHQADLVIAVIPALFGAHVARILARRKNARLGIYVQDVMSAAARQSGYPGGRTLSKLALAIERTGLRRADAITTIHPRMASELARIAQVNVTPTVIYNWVHLSGLAKDPQAMRARLGWNENEIVVLHSGNMGSKQNLEVVIDAARISERLELPIRYVLAGGGSQRLHLESYAKGCASIEFIDAVHESEYLDLLAAADILLVNERPGMREMSLPSKLTSYLSARRPILAATDPRGTTADFVAATSAGIVIPAGDPKALVDATQALANAPQQRNELGSRGYDFAQTKLTSEAALHAYDDWIETTIGSRANHTQGFVH